MYRHAAGVEYAVRTVSATIAQIKRFGGVSVCYKVVGCLSPTALSGVPPDAANRVAASSGIKLRKSNIPRRQPESLHAAMDSNRSLSLGMDTLSPPPATHRLQGLRPRIPTDARIGVVGGGASGLAAAWALERLGYQHVTVLEQHHTVGGMCETVSIQGRMYDLGGQVLAEGRSPTIAALQAHLGVEMEDLSEHKQMMVASDGAVAELKVFKDFVRMVPLTVKLQAEVVAKAGDRIGVHAVADLAGETSEEYVRSRSVPVLPVSVAATFTSSGYGYPADIPYAYLHEFNRTSLLGKIRRVRGGYTSLWQKLAASLSDVRCNARVTRIMRDAAAGRVTVRGTDSAGDFEVQFDKIIVTGALALRNCGSTYRSGSGADPGVLDGPLDVTQVERSLFARVRTVEYYTTVLKIRGLGPDRFPAGFFYLEDYIFDPATMGHPVAMQRFFPDTDIFLFWSYGNADVSQEQVTAYIYQDVEKVLHGTVEEFVLQRKWTYFPHVDSQEMKAGFYDELSRLQGQNSTYYAGGLWAFELTERNACFAMDLVAQHFGSTEPPGKPYIKRLIQVATDERKGAPTSALPGYDVDRLTEMPGIQFPDLPALDAYLHFYANHELTKDKVLYTWLDDQGKETDQRTYADLNLRASVVAHRLLSCKTDVKAGDRVLLLHPPGLEFVEAFFGCLRARVLAVPLIPPDPGQGSCQALLKVENVAKACGAKLILCTASYHAAVRAANLASRITSRSAGKEGGRWPHLPWYHTDSWTRNVAYKPKWSSWLLDRINVSSPGGRDGASHTSLSPVSSPSNGHSLVENESGNGSPRAFRSSRPPPSPRRFPSFSRIPSFNSLSSSSSPAAGNDPRTDSSSPQSEASKDSGYSSSDSSSEAAECYEFVAPKAEDVCFLQFTSGSTGESKGVMITHGGLIHNVKLMRRVYQSTSKTVLISWLPQYHDMGLIGGLFTALVSGGTAVLFSPTSFIKKPLLWMESLSRYRGTHTAGPNFAFELTVRRMEMLQSMDKPAPKFDLSALRFLMISAEPIRHHTVTRFLDMLRDSGLREQIMAPGYGLAENCVFVSTTYGQKRPIYVDSENRVCCGIVQRDNEDMDIRIVDPDTGVETEEAQEGEIWLSSPSAAIGYWGLPELSEETFYNGLSSAPKGRRFVRTGDLGRVIGDSLFVTGRIKDLIIVAGRNIYPSDIEKTVESCSDALRPGCSAVFGAPMTALQRMMDNGGRGEAVSDGSPDDVGIVIATEVRDDKRVDPELVGRIKAAVAEEHGVEVAHVKLLKPRTIAKTTSGKIRRQECLNRFLNDTLVTAKPNVLLNPRSPLAKRIRRSESAPLSMRKASFSSSAPAPGAPPSPSSTAARPTKQEINRFLVHIVAERTGILASQVSETHSFSSYNIDSVAIVWAASKLSDFLGVHIAAIDIYTAGCISELADMADALLSKHNGPAAVTSPGPPVGHSVAPASNQGTRLSEKEIEDYLVKLVAERTGLPTEHVSTTDVLTTFGIDSVGVVWAAQKLSEYLGIHIAAIDIYTAGSVGELASMAFHLLKKAGSGDSSNSNPPVAPPSTTFAAIGFGSTVEEEIETELIPDAELAAALEPSRLRKLIITGLQVLGILYIAALFILPAFVVYGKLASLITLDTESGEWAPLFSLLWAIALLPAGWLAYLGLTALTIAFFATTLLRPNYTIQTAIPLWSVEYVKWWVLYRICDFASNHVVGVHLRGSIFLTYWYRLLGAQIGKHVFVDTTDITDPSLLYVGNGAVISEGATIQSHDVRGGIVRFRPVRLGTGSVVGPFALVQQGTILDAGARVSALSKTEIGEKVVKKQDPEEATPSTHTQNLKVAARGLSPLSVAARQLLGLYLVGFVSTVSAIISYSFFLWLTSKLLVAKEDSMAGFSSRVQYGFFCFSVAATLPWALAGLAPVLAFHDPAPIINFLDTVATFRDALTIVACSAAGYLVYGLALSAITCALKWQLIGNVLSQRVAQEETLPVNSDLGIKVWLVHRLLAAAHMKVTVFLSGTDTLAFYLRSLGSKIGNMASIRGVNPLLDPDLLSLGDGSHLGDFAKIITSTIHQRTEMKQAGYRPCYRFGKLEVGARCVVGAQSLLMPGSKLQDRVILGANSVATTGSILQEGGVYVGVDKPVMIYQQTADGMIISEPKELPGKGEVEEHDYRIVEMDPFYKRLVANLAANIAKTTLSVDARYFHRLGVAGKGTLTIFSSLDNIPAHDVFAPQKSYSIIVRHSNSLSGDDDARSDARGASVRILRPEAGENVEDSLLDLTMKSGEAFHCSNMLQFIHYMMKSHEERVIFVQKHPLSGKASWGSLRLPNSYAELHYYSNVARLFRPSASSKEYYVKFGMRPIDARFGKEEGKVEAFDSIPPETGAIPRSPDDTRAPRFLADDFRKRLLSAEGVQYIFSLQLRPVSKDSTENEDALDCTKPWDEAVYPYTDVGMVHLTEIVDGDVTERIRFNPINGPNSVDLVPAKTALENASIDHGRSLAYDIAQYLRTGRPLPPSWDTLLKASDISVQLPQDVGAEVACSGMRHNNISASGGCPAMSGSMSLDITVSQPVIARSRYQQMPALHRKQTAQDPEAETGDNTLAEKQEARNILTKTRDRDLLTRLVQDLMRWMQPLLQLFVPIFLYALAFYPTLFALSFVASKLGTTWMHSLLPAAYLLAALLLTWFAVVCRWALVGTTKDGSASDLWGIKSLRDTTWQAINVLLSHTFLELGKGSLLASLYLQSLGAKIGDSAGRVAYLDTLLALNPDLLTIGAGTAVGRNALIFGHLYEGEQVKFKANEIGQSCYVGCRALVLPGLKMEDGAELGALSLGMKGEVIAAY